MQKNKRVILGLYDLFIAAGAFWIGTEMIRSDRGLFGEEYPESWLLALPFENWAQPGIIGLLIFGVGNLLTAYFSFSKESHASWIPSAFLGTFFFVCMILQPIVFKETYIVTYPFLLLSIVQLSLSIYVGIGCLRRHAHQVK